MAILVLGTIKDLADGIVFFFYYLLEHLYLFVSVCSLILRVSQCALEALYFAPEVPNLLRFVYLLLVFHILLDLLDLFKASVHLVFVVLGDVLAKLLKFVLKLRVRRLFLSRRLGLLGLGIFKSLRLLLLELVHEHLDLLLVAAHLFHEDVALRPRRVVPGGSIGRIVRPQGRSGRVLRLYGRQRRLPPFSGGLLVLVVLLVPQLRETLREDVRRLPDVICGGILSWLHIVRVPVPGV